LTDNFKGKKRSMYDADGDDSL